MTCERCGQSWASHMIYVRECFHCADCCDCEEEE